MRHHLTRVLVSLPILLMPTLSACGDTPTDRTEKSERTDLTVEQVLEKSRKHARESLKLFGPGAQVTETDRASALWCSDLSSPPKGTPIHVLTFANVADSGLTHEEMQKRFREHWEGKGWKLDFSDESETSMSSPDGFTVALTTANKVGLDTDSPCIPGKAGMLPDRYEDQ